MVDGRMPFEVPHALDGDSQEFQSGVCVTLFVLRCMVTRLLMVVLYCQVHVTKQVCGLPTRQRYWNCQQKAPGPVVKLDLEIDWPVSCQINLTEPGWSALAPCLMAECPFEVPHALDDSQEFEIWVCDFLV